MLDTTLCNSYLSVNLQTIINNMQSIQEDIGPDVECIPVLKDNAYCLGAVPIAKALCTYANVRTIAVAQVCEGVELRQAGLSAPAVLVLGGVPERLFPAAVEYGLQLTVFHPSTVYALEKLAAAQGKRAEVQIKVETGLNRTGAKPGAELGALAAALAACPHVRIDPPQKHMCNSGGSDWFRASFCNAVRIGRRLYMDNQAEPLTPGTPGAVQEACSWRASVTNLRVVEAGDTVGYDAAWTAPRRTRVATVCVGYGDGLYYPLAEAGGPLLVGGQKARLLATCMDQCFVDVTDIPCRAGDEVTFFGQSSGGAAMPIQELGKFMHVEGVYFYSFLSPRVARVYEGLEP